MSGRQINKYLLIITTEIKIKIKIKLPSAKTRMKMLNAVTSMGHLPHTKFDNQQTHYDSVRSGFQLDHCFSGEIRIITRKNSAIFWKFLSN